MGTANVTVRPCLHRCSVPLVDIHPITPDRVDDYFLLFDNAFKDNPHWAGCYCAFYDDPRPDEDWDPADEKSGLANREFRRDYIMRGRALGLLAYEDGPIGWVNAAPRDSYGNLRVFEEAVEDDDPPVGSIMCFVVRPDRRNQGVATALLESVDAYLRDLGMEIVEAYPRKAPSNRPDLPWTAAYYKGTPTMYENAGFERYREFDYFISMRKGI